MAKSALIECPTCQHQVSRTAAACPSCGAVLRKPRRSLFGKLTVGVFWVFNALMALWIFAAMRQGSEFQESLATEAERAGAAVGTGIGVTMLLILWVIGAVILGLMALLTRPKT